MAYIETVTRCETSTTLPATSIPLPGTVCEYFVAESADYFVQAVSPHHPVITCLVQTLGGFRFICCTSSGFHTAEEVTTFCKHEWHP